MQSETKTRLKKILAFTLIPLAIMLAFFGGYFSRYIFQSDTISTTSDILTIIEKVGYVYDPVTGEKREITEEEIADLIVGEFLDQYSAYYSEEEYNTVSDNADGKFIGIGITIDGNGLITSVTLNSPAELAGLKKGDVALSVSVDGDEPTPFSYNHGVEFRQKLLGSELGRTVTLTVLRGEEQLKIDVVKKSYLASYVQYIDSEKTLNFRGDSGSLSPEPTEGGMASLDSKTAYVQFTSFNGDAKEQIEKALDYMLERGRTKLILDLRDNGGGYLEVLEDVSAFFINNGGKSRNLIAYAEGKKGSESFYTSGNDFYGNITDISVLANDGTASASECLIGAMLHYGDCFNMDRLVIEKNSKGVAKTYGKGIMQTTYGLVNGGAIKLTTAKIYLPDKQTSIHGVGFIPLEANAVEKDGALARAIEILS